MVEEADSPRPRVAVLPDPDGSAADVVQRAGAEVVPLERAEALVWTLSRLESFPDELPESVRWVQLPSAGVEQWVREGIVDQRRVWTSATGAYAVPVAEHALLLLLAGVRRLADCVRADTWSKESLMPAVGTLAGATVAIIGCGAIGRALIPMLASVGAGTIAVNRSGRPVDGAVRTLPAAESAQAWAEADHVVLAAPATEATHHLVTAERLGSMRPHAWLVNVARGSLVDTDALVEALDAGAIAGAALDVTDPEPLPDGHPLWNHPRCIITPHVANPEVTLRSGFLQRVADNVRRWAGGRALLGVIDPAVGY